MESQWIGVPDPGLETRSDLVVCATVLPFLCVPPFAPGQNTKPGEMVSDSYIVPYDL